ncbi:phosphoenolpyruvate--protein phosphotransferase [Roseibacillus persicicus]|uniref:Phosphoenolpyruvate-protein phosphotransferase n=1 Tax=Roseibacillus persicicus TaxID=454148 RepID=A0A918WF90_9BACT|nr:phosphoenolpyruvate--protein phosphotransferase [Roseibacillus persicicus]MDQ8191487.1 phosphoenolpyruvate--protein phosphotransferase [Roseibacillus persicicus]GHC42924.1 phosphoenolpyruvate-protein phosphotransferase [Roseibacillus persicicus]
MGEGREQIFDGEAVSQGIAFGPVHVLARGFAAPEVYAVAPHQVPTERERFRRALERTKEQLASLRTQIESISGEAEGRIFESHLMILQDQTLVDRVNDAISSRQQNAEFCFYAIMQTFLEAMRRISDPYLRERTSDIEDVSQRVLQNFSASSPEEDESPDHRHILVTYDLNPSDTAGLDPQRTLGFATERGSSVSHTAILARSMGIPAVVGLKNAVLGIRTLSNCIIDGYEGKLIVNPTPETAARYRALAEEREIFKTSLKEIRDSDTATLDDRRITLSANVEFEHELNQVAESGANGIGLFRTEFFMLETGEFPDEPRQARLYRQVVESVAPKQAIIRTLDVGGDKLPGEPLAEPEPNPFLGWRGIRYSLDRRDVFKDQLRAILRASVHGKVGIMFPLISGLREIREAVDVLDQCREDLADKGIPFSDDIEVGAMIEVPSAALMAKEIAAHVDFLSIGTNDLIQYTVAVDRVNPRVSQLYKPAHPSVMRLIKMTIDGGRENGIWIGICGEMAADLILLPVLVGLGIDELSVGTPRLPSVKHAIRALNYEECKALADEALTLPESRLIMQASREVAMKAYPELLK